MKRFALLVALMAGGVWATALPERHVVLDHAGGHRPPSDAPEAGCRFLEKHLNNNPTDKEQK